MTKRCTRCHKMYPIETHFTSIQKRDLKRCKICREKKHEYKKQRKVENVKNLQEKEKQCSVCYKISQIEMFMSSRTERVRDTCEICKNKMLKQSTERKRKKTMNVKEDEKLCTMCEKIFCIKTHFKSTTIYETHTCKICRENADKKYNDVNNKYQKRKTIYLELKQNEIEKKNGCEWVEDSQTNVLSAQKLDQYECHEMNIDAIQFDHINPKEKKISISNWANNFSYDKNVLVNEINKC